MHFFRHRQAARVVSTVTPHRGGSRTSIRPAWRSRCGLG